MHLRIHPLQCELFSSFFITRPGLARAVLQTALSFIIWLNKSPFPFISSKHLHSQTKTDRQLTFWQDVHITHMSRVMCHMYKVTCHMSNITYNVFNFTDHYFFLFVLQLDGAGWWRVCYQWGLPHLVWSFLLCNNWTTPLNLGYKNNKHIKTMLQDILVFVLSVGHLWKGNL